MDFAMRQRLLRHGYARRGRAHHQSPGDGVRKTAHLISSDPLLSRTDSVRARYLRSRVFRQSIKRESRTCSTSSSLELRESKEDI